MQPTATLIAYFHTCHRKMWLHANEIRMEHTSDLVAEGKLIGETTYARRAGNYTEIQLDGIKIDFYDAKNRVVHETKRGRAMEAAHRAQVRYYLYKLRQNGVSDASGLIEYPDLRRTETVPMLTQTDVDEIASWEDAVRRIVAQEHCPEVVRKPYCKQCAFHDLCYVADE